MKFGNMQDWQSDPELEANGVKFDIGRDRWILMRRAGGANRAFLAAYGTLIARLGGDGGPESIAQALITEGLQPIFAQHVILDWGGICDETGLEVEFSKEAFLELMKSAPDLWVRIRTEADRRERFQRETLEREKTQMGKSSSGKRNGGRSAHA